MFRSQYDTDVTTFSPQGRLLQVEYAMEAVKQGSAVVGVCSATHVVLAALKRSFSDLAWHQRKIVPIDEHIGVAISGIAADARVLTKRMRDECLQHRFVYGDAMPVGRLVHLVADLCQKCTQRISRRPYGVGLLVAGVDESGPHLYQTCPSGEVYDLVGMALGARSQSARTYLERHMDEFSSASREALIRHALWALNETLASAKDQHLSAENCAVGVVSIGDDMRFHLYEHEQVQPLLDACAFPKSGGTATETSTEQAPQNVTDSDEHHDATMQQDTP
ncbi:20S core proteasome subunit alpha 6 [Cyanidioschyzon merolae strain 10D]|jgi:20S proteasome subunit alpha 6|uniref:Proteasome subunit alpha type n=1 Tax=Cyanidioschyzon merolae (strain NIES-3377 / 10D) TaxID=280699 RepID=M1UPJ8_CYAM1|nr:20S core proteasome subunit alpha 6 [Cyanidioschyzon merolae strain 10D]BAM79346.1 20S core proteasome subunit alpha 6 [Cyanidioschyzon merolae strain 10D]|eukprot:XP_005535632.1 20S core proteasome subunit alpha 6 [Cyanidioschyzon merolae strain 10D]